MTPEELARKRAANAAWQKANRDKCREYNNKYRSKPSVKEKQKEYDKRHRIRHPGSMLIAKRKWYKANKPKIRLVARKLALKTKFGMTLDDFNRMFESQDKKCAVCLSENSGAKIDWAVDHCHSTGKVRGILCHPCNRILHWKVTPEILHRAADYLERNSHDD